MKSKIIKISASVFACLMAVSGLGGCGGDEIFDEYTIVIDGGGDIGNFNSTVSMDKTESNPFPYNTLEVLCEGYDDEDEAYFGRTYADSPDIDGKIWFPSEETVHPGDFVRVTVTDVYDGELIGEREDEV